MIEVHRILLEIHRILLANICIQNGTAKTADHFSLFRSILRSVERTEKLYVISGAAKKCINTSSDQELEIMWLYRVRGEESEGERRGLGTERQTNKISCFVESNQLLASEIHSGAVFLLLPKN